jgi:hypothetical protein
MASFTNFIFEVNLFSKSMHYFCRPHPMSINKKQQFSLGTIHLRRRQIFTIFDPSAFQQNAYEGDF